jgi:hypothetical protein
MTAEGGHRRTAAALEITLPPPAARQGWCWPRERQVKMRWSERQAQRHEPQVLVGYDPRKQGRDVLKGLLRQEGLQEQKLQQ